MDTDFYTLGFNGRLCGDLMLIEEAVHDLKRYMEERGVSDVYIEIGVASQCKPSDIGPNGIDLRQPLRDVFTDDLGSLVSGWRNILLTSNVITLSDLCNCTKADLLGIWGLGDMSVAAISRALDSLGLELKS